MAHVHDLVAMLLTLLEMIVLHISYSCNICKPRHLWISKWHLWECTWCCNYYIVWPTWIHKLTRIWWLAPRHWPTSKSSYKMLNILGQCWICRCWFSSKLAYQKKEHFANHKICMYITTHWYILSKWLALKRATSTTKHPIIGFWDNVRCIIESLIPT